ncbi:response regulator [Fervidobacterium sp. 2310opik-2]|uniref:ATP-binding response regulator n=1 Tax=Fervidobacterium sp. 2310opik-2 TaxID=1755815 RepID=UPI0013DEA6B1|nr:response regulator [Fervidobacterium sp. 2310opik-2]KAF2960874.1 chemotaxis protein CheA [Fervidobacterium sp. 2310opik-2]
MDFLEMFFEELREKGNESINDIKSFLESRDGALINDIYRLFHTIKGSASLVGLVGYKDLFHKIEDYFKSYLAGQGELSDEFLSRLLSIIPPLLERDGDLSESEVQDLIDRLEGKKEAETTIFSKEQGALSVEDIQEFLSMALTTENSLMRGDINSALRIIRLAKSKLTSTIQELYYTKLRNILLNFDTLIVQEATNAKKKVRLNLEIGDEMVEKKDSKALIDILVHLVRNSISHGIESPDERKKIGKDEIGVITIRSYVLNNELYLEVEDDGQGIDFEKVRKKAMERNLGHLRPEDVIFVPGFSTKEEADGTAGRGVGLDAVKNFAMARGGDVEFVTTPGKGTRFIIHFPVKSFLIKVLVLEADGQQFCISTQDVLEIVTKLKAIDGKVKYKDKVCDVVYKSSNPRFGIITRNYRAIFVDNIVGIFDGQVSSESYPSVKGFVKNVYVYPLPIIDIDSFREGEVKKTKKINVLLVDDSVVTRSVVSKFLEAFGYEVIEAKNGSEAISYVESSNCDVVVCDVEMPDIDGFETTRRIKQIKKELPVILFSTLSKEQLAKGLEVGADAYLSKEESPERLLRLIEKLVG